MTYSIPLTAGVDLKLYNSAVTFAKPEVLTDEAGLVRVRISTKASAVQYETVVGELIHPGVVKRGAYAEFFHRDARGRRQWQTPSMIGLAGVEWTIEVSEVQAGTYEIEFKR